MTQDQNREESAQPMQDGYVTAFYDVAKLLGIGARADSPKVVWEREMLPLLQARLAHQAPPATQPVAGVGEVERALFDMIDGFSEFMDIVPAERAKMRERARRLATLQTPPPVATATVVDAGEVEAAAISLIVDLCGAGASQSAANVRVVEDHLRQFAKRLAATPTPQAGDQ